MNFSILELPKPFTVIWMSSASVSDLNLHLFFKPGLISKSKPAALLPVMPCLVTVTIPLPNLSSILTSSPQRAGPLLPCINDGSKSAYPCKLAFICQHLCTGLQLLLTPELLQKHSYFSSRASSDWYFKKKSSEFKDLGRDFWSNTLAIRSATVYYSFLNALCASRCTGLDAVTHLGMFQTATTCKTIALPACLLIRVGSCTRMWQKIIISGAYPQAFSGYLNFFLNCTRVKFARALFTNAHALKAQHTWNSVLVAVLEHQFSSWRSAQTCPEVCWVFDVL